LRSRTGHRMTATGRCRQELFQRQRRRARRNAGSGPD
jgi:hypothetical protein